MADSVKFTALFSDGDNSRWKYALLSLALSLVVLVFVFYDTFASMVNTWWQSGTFEHGFFILPIVGYLVWDKIEILGSVSVKPQYSVVMLVLVLLFTWFCAEVLSVEVVKQFAVVALMATLVWLFCGKEVAAVLMFPLCYLFFAVPFGDFLIPTLQDFTAAFAVKVLQLQSIPVYLEGRYFHIPSGSFKVEEGCSGIRYLIASVSLGTLYAYLIYRSNVRRVLFIVFSVVVPILANAVRAYGIVMIAHLSDYQMAVGVDHIIYGWIFFGVIIGLMFWVGHFFKDAIPSRPTAKPIIGGGTKVTPVVYAPVTILVVFFLGVTSVLAELVYSDVQESTLQDVQLPSALHGWSGPLRAQSYWSPQFKGVTFDRKAQYVSGAQSVDVYIGYYAQQTQGAELINSQNHFFNDGWTRVGERSVKLNVANYGTWDINEFDLNSTTKNRIVWYWYAVGGHYTVSAVLAKLFELPTRLMLENSGATVYAISTTYELESEEARRDLTGFLDDMLSPLLQSVNQGGKKPS